MDGAWRQQPPLLAGKFGVKHLRLKWARRWAACTPGSGRRRSRVHGANLALAAAWQDRAHDEVREAGDGFIGPTRVEGGRVESPRGGAARRAWRCFFLHWQRGAAAMAQLPRRGSDKSRDEWMAKTVGRTTRMIYPLRFDASARLRVGRRNLGRLRRRSRTATQVATRGDPRRLVLEGR